MASTDDDGCGVLVGWTSQDLGRRMVLKLQTVTTPPPHKDEDVHTFTFVVDKNVAVQLGNYLFQATGQTSPRKAKRSWLDRLLGG